MLIVVLESAKLGSRSWFDSPVGQVVSESMSNGVRGMMLNQPEIAEQAMSLTTPERLV